MSNFEFVNVDGEIPSQVELEVLESTFNNRIREFNINNRGFKHMEEFFINAFKIYESEINETVNQFDFIKTLSYFIAVFKRAFIANEHEEPLFEKRVVHIPTKTIEINKTTNVSEHFKNNIVDYFTRKVDEVMVEGSGFTLDKIEKLLVKIYKYEPLKGAGYIELPRKLKNKKAIVNLKNTDDKCFKWSIIAALHYDEVYELNRKKVNDATRYEKWKDELNFDGIDFPVQLNQIEKFMNQNAPIAVNVYYFDSETECVKPIFLATKPIESRYVHLLLLTETVTSNEETLEVGIHSHYCWIKNFSALVHTQITKNTRKLFVCDRCLNYFSSQEKLNEHKIICITTNKCAIELPLPGENFESFKNYKNELKAPFIVYADTEALLKQPETPIYNDDCSSHAHHRHEVHSIGYYFMCDEKITNISPWYASHRGPKCLKWFMNELTRIAEMVFRFLEDIKPMEPLTKEEEEMFWKTSFCHICKKDFNKDDIRVKDHNHIDGRYRGCSHQICNINYQITRNIPVVMHNLSGYDSHLLIRMLGSDKQIPGEITIIPHNSEKYISFIKKMRGVGSWSYFRKYAHEIKFKFIDSMRFMSASLDYLAGLIPHEKKQILKSECEKYNYSSEMFTLLTRKGVFPYEYIDDYKKLEENMLPSRERFYSMLTQSNITEEEYNHAQKVWEKFGLQTLGEYSDLYLKTDVLLLADIFENFRTTCHATYSLDPAHYFGAAGLSFDSMLRYTRVTIEVFTCINMLMFVEKSIRGGVSQINTRYVRANNKYMDSEFDPSKESTYLMYLDGK